MRKLLAVITCDRCGKRKELPGDPYRGGAIDLPLNWKTVEHGKIEHDLCEECSRALDVFFDKQAHLEQI